MVPNGGGGGEGEWYLKGRKGGIVPEGRKRVMVPKGAERENGT